MKFFTQASLVVSWLKSDFSCFICFIIFVLLCRILTNSEDITVIMFKGATDELAATLSAIGISKSISTSLFPTSFDTWGSRWLILWGFLWLCFFCWYLFFFFFGCSLLFPFFSNWSGWSCCRLRSFYCNRRCNRFFFFFYFLFSPWEPNPCRGD